MDWLDDLLEIYFFIGFVYCFNCFDCLIKLEFINLFLICWMYIGMCMYVALRILSYDGLCVE